MKTLINIKSITAKLGLSAILGLAVGLNSCEQFNLDEDPTEALLAVVPYTNVQELDLAVTGIYGQLNKAAWMTTFYVNGWSGDDMTTHRASNKADFREYDQRNVVPSNGRTITNWRGVYSMVLAANTVLANLEGVELAEKAMQDQLTGETYFLRGLMFYHLARIHGRIPLPLSIEVDPEIGRASFEEVYGQIESDMLEAERLLPMSSNVGATRPNKGSARAILARLYLDWAGFPVKDNSKYAMAAASAKQVIDNAGAYGFALEEDMASLFTIAGRQNRESVFSIAYCASCGLPNRKTGKLGLPGGAPTNGWQETFAEIRFFEDFPEGPRKEATYHAAMPLDANGNIIADASTEPVDSLPWTEFKDQQNPVFRKIVGPFEEATWTGFESDRYDYYMRFAEVLLIYAEASGEAGSPSADAWEALNSVRLRAGLDAVSDADGTLQDLAFTERKWELAGEYLRYNDLVRKEKVEEALGGTARDPRVSIGTMFDGDGNATPFQLTAPSNPILGSLSTDNYFAPIPQVEIDRLPNLAN
ncbi:RagB/SusD family nutrient uptake outer membrane protein [Croceivirga sp. JEA036]|uniref:RagB/SusD family nutrient uptake outer membrane protein n=1 Tax=Croceivirga sp. JEA036 TaxID=2721162 RepID=UPI00143B0594|nr:RagB/SusD family nutrient uptake outer membrane protein [Croceivirga sp. JEA036]NJB35206.1 RagB/SusD family nutrient uptake outer membrane protein [Croceivirga sp. JEA036]